MIFGRAHPQVGAPVDQGPWPDNGRKTSSEDYQFPGLDPGGTRSDIATFLQYNTEIDRLLENGLSETNQSPDI